ncbi:hypothetical protein [Allorhodopirellula solitaria]|uniref:Uncharacterized protein n=1 Tax=Allorhodopirellula solitaria TaxID=2527987 RepID=A0A5C5YHD4_9BACT|nr:hypothetical protein [Allorhodopirellula solitaria]TWT74121.1 hypothetical protein CA85_10070 [Allorhodopirellula solitaria]
MMFKSHQHAPLSLPHASRQPLGTTCCLVAGCVSMLLLHTGCQQTGAPAGGATMAPVSGLPGQTSTTGPAMPALGPFGASARVPPPATGSYGTPAGQAGGATNAMPANYAPPNIAPMSYNDAGNTNQIAVAGGAPGTQASIQGATPAGNSSWHETGAYPTANINPAMDLSNDAATGVRSGGMPVNDLTGAPPPPGYTGTMGYASPMGAAAQPNYAPSYTPQASYPQASTPQQPAQPGQYPATNLTPTSSADANGWAPPPNSSSPNTIVPNGAAPVPMNPPNAPAPMPTSGAGFVDASPAANQPSMSTANRPVQWQTPRH